MPAPIIAAVITAVVGAAVTGIGMAIEAGQRGEAQRIRQEVANKYGSEALAQLDKALVQEIPASALAGVVEDSTLRNAQLGVLRELENEYRTGGMSAADIASGRLVQQDAAATAAGQQANAEVMMARRGQQMNPALGAAMAAQSGQTAANAVGRAGMQLQADARLRALRALEGAGSLAGNIRGDDWRAMSAKAAAQDRLNEYNNEMGFRVQQYNNAMKQQDYDNRMQRLIAQGNARQGLASGYDAAGARASEGFGGLGQAVVKGGQAFASQKAYEEYLKNRGG